MRNFGNYDMFLDDERFPPELLKDGRDWVIVQGAVHDDELKRA